MLNLIISIAKDHMQKLLEYIDFNLKPINNTILAFTSGSLDIVENKIQKKVNLD